MENKYVFVSWDVDPTGRRLVDEICHLAGYTPEDIFDQYIMPHRDVDFVARKRHQIRTVTIGRYRILKETRQGMFLKTKSELYALLDFLVWLEGVKKMNKKNVVLFNYEKYKLAPHLLIEGLKRYNLMERFKDTVGGFINIYPVVKEKCEPTMSSYSLRTLARVLLDKENEDTSNACDRAKLIYQILQHLCAGGGDDETKNMFDMVHHLYTSIEYEENEIEIVKHRLNLQNTLKPIFQNLLKNSKRRKRTTHLRHYLTTASIDYEMLKSALSEGLETFESYLASKIDFKTDKDLKELSQILTGHFYKASTAAEKQTTFIRRTYRGSRKSSERTSEKPKSDDDDESRSYQESRSTMDQTISEPNSECSIGPKVTTSENSTLSSEPSGK